MERGGFERWLEGYFSAWISNDADDVAALFVGDAVYSVGPFTAAWTGRDEIVRRWIGGAQEDVEYAYEILAVEGDTGHRALEREGDERGSGGAGRMGWDPVDHLRAGRPVPGASRVAGSPGAAARLSRSPGRTSVPMWHSST